MLANKETRIIINEKLRFQFSMNTKLSPYLTETKTNINKLMKLNIPDICANVSFF